MFLSNNSKLALRSKAMLQAQKTAEMPWPEKSAFYYLMKNGFILRLESPLPEKKVNIPLMIRANLFDQNNFYPLTQDQANYRVAIFRDEILEMPEYEERVFGLSH